MLNSTDVQSTTNMQSDNVTNPEISVTEARQILMANLPIMQEAIKLANKRLRLASGLSPTIMNNHEDMPKEEEANIPHTRKKHASVIHTICLAAYLVPETLKMIRQFDGIFNNQELRKFLFGSGTKLSQPLFSGIAKEPSHLIGSSSSFFKRAGRVGGMGTKILAAFVAAEIAAEHWPELLENVQELPTTVKRNINEYIDRGRAEMKEWQITGEDYGYEIIPPTSSIGSDEMKESCEDKSHIIYPLSPTTRQSSDQPSASKENQPEEKKAFRQF